MSKTKSTSIDKVVKQELDDMLEENSKLRKAYEDHCKKTGTKAVDMLKKLMKDSPEVEAVRWTQYTPHFNDGDECTFSVHELEFKFNEDLLPRNEESGEDEDEEGWVQEWRLDKFFERQTDVMNFKDVSVIEKKVAVMQEVHGYLQGMDDQLKEAFGDHVQVTVTRSGIETEEYNHD